MMVSMMIAQILTQISPTAIPLTETLSTGAVVAFALWYLYNENQRIKAEFREDKLKLEGENKTLQDKYDTLIKDCHDREIDLIGRSNHSRRNEN